MADLWRMTIHMEGVAPFEFECEAESWGQACEIGRDWHPGATVDSVCIVPGPEERS